MKWVILACLGMVMMMSTVYITFHKEGDNALWNVIYKEGQGTLYIKIRSEYENFTVYDWRLNGFHRVYKTYDWTTNEYSGGYVEVGGYDEGVDFIYRNPFPIWGQIRYIDEPPNKWQKPRYWYMIDLPVVGLVPEWLKDVDELLICVEGNRYITYPTVSRENYEFRGDNIPCLKIECSFDTKYLILYVDNELLMYGEYGDESGVVWMSELVDTSMYVKEVPEEITIPVVGKVSRDWLRYAGIGFMLTGIVGMITERRRKYES